MRKKKEKPYKKDKMRTSLTLIMKNKTLSGSSYLRRVRKGKSSIKKKTRSERLN